MKWLVKRKRVGGGAPAGHKYTLITPVRRAHGGWWRQHPSRAMRGRSFHHSAVRIQRRGEGGEGGGSKIERLPPTSRRPGSKSRHRHAGCRRGGGVGAASRPADSRLKGARPSGRPRAPSDGGRGREMNQVGSGTDGNLIRALFTSMEK